MTWYRGRRCASPRCRTTARRPARWCADGPVPDLRTRVPGRDRRRGDPGGAARLCHADQLHRRHRGRRPCRADDRQPGPALARPPPAAGRQGVHAVARVCARPAGQGLLRRDHRRQRLVPEQRHADADGRGARLPRAPHDRHEEPRVHAQHSHRRSVPPAGSGGGLRGRGRQPARPEAGPARRRPLVPHPAGHLRHQPDDGPARCAGADQGERFRLPQPGRPRQRLVHVRRPRRRPARPGAAVHVPPQRARAEPCS